MKNNSDINSNIMTQIANNSTKLCLYFNHTIICSDNNILRSYKLSRNQISAIWVFELKISCHILYYVGNG